MTDEAEPRVCQKCGGTEGAFVNGAHPFSEAPYWLHNRLLTRCSVNEIDEWLREQINEDLLEIGKHPDEPWDDDRFTAGTAKGYPCEDILTIGKSSALAELSAKIRLLDWLNSAEQSATGIWQRQFDQARKIMAYPYRHSAGYKKEWGNCADPDCRYEHP